MDVVFAYVSKFTTNKLQNLLQKNYKKFNWGANEFTIDKFVLKFIYLFK